MKRWIRRWTAVPVMLLMLSLAAAASAQSAPLDTYDVSDHESLGFARPVGFTAGCREESGALFLLVDTLGFNGYYLMTDPQGTGNWIIFSGGMMIEAGSRVTLSAQDAMHCMVSVERGGQTERWRFAEEPDPWSEPDWVLSRYECTQEDGSSFCADFGDCRADVTQTENGQTRTERVYYAFFRDANNLDYAKLPRSMDDALRLQQAHPVAAVSTKTQGDRVNLRKGPGTEHSMAGSLYSGAMLQVRDVQNGWAHVYAGDAGLWISCDYLVFGSAIDGVRDDTVPARTRAADRIEVSRMPYQGGGGTVTLMPGGAQVRVIGEYNSKWRIVGDVFGSLYVRPQDLE